MNEIKWKIQEVWRYFEELLKDSENYIESPMVSKISRNWNVFFYGTIMNKLILNYDQGISNDFYDFKRFQ